MHTFARLACGLALVSAALPAWGQSPDDASAQLSPAGRAAYLRLRNAPRFEGRQIGIDHGPSALVTAWRTVFREPDADRAFKALLREGTDAGRLYGLAGLYFTDPDRMVREASGPAFLDGWVETLVFDLAARQRVGKLALEIRDGRWSCDFIRGMRLRPAT